MEAFYCGAAALERVVDAALGFYGLEVDAAAGGRRPTPARTFADQTRRIDLGGKVVALVRRSVPVGEDDRRLICWLVDGACARLEEAERPVPPRPCEGATSHGVASYAAAGGGAVGQFADFARRSPSSIPMLEPATAEPATAEPASRQDVRPMPATTNPAPRKTPPGTAAPAKTDPARTIRSSRWSAPRKEVKR